MITVSDPPAVLDDGARSSTSAAAAYLAGLAPLGAYSQRSALERLAEWLGWPPSTALTTFPWGSVRYEHAIAIRGRLLRDPEFAPATSNRYLTALRRVCREAYTLGQMSREDYDRVSSVPSVRGSRIAAGRALAPSELAELFRAAAAPLDGAILALLFGAGLRRGEIVALDLEHLEESDPALRVIGKGNKQRRVFLPEGAWSYVQAWIRERGREPGPLLLARTRAAPAPTRLTVWMVYARVRLLARRAQLERPISPHDLRRTYITELLEHGADLLSVQALAGHAQPTTTARYDRRSEQARARVARSLGVPVPERAA